MFDDNSILENEAECKPHLLEDVSSAGRKRPWRTHRLNSILLSQSYRRLGQNKKAERCEDCGSLLRFVGCEQHGHLQLTGANFCKVRLCSMCGWRKSLVTAFQVRRVCHEANERENLSWLFLTLTVRNCQADELSGTLDKMFDGWKRFVKRKAFDSAVVGWFRGLEVTRNNDARSIWHRTYHPHFHVLVCVRPSYFKGKSKGYLTQKDWQALWQSAMRLDYDPVIDVRPVKPKSEMSEIGELAGIADLEQAKVRLKALESAVAETAKYATKSNDYLIYEDYEIKYVEGDKGKKREKVVPKFDSGINEAETDEAVSTLDSALSGRRLLGYGGLLKDIWAELADRGEVVDAEDENADLVHVNGTPGCKCPTCNSELTDTIYRWHSGVKNYVSIVK